MAVASFCTACGGGTENGVTLDRSTVQMDRFERTTLKAETTGEGAVVWESSDATVASVDANGVITSLKEGETKITATVEGVGAAECAVTVVSSGKSPVLAQGWETKEVAVGAEIVLDYTLTYKDANVAAGAVFTSTVGNPSVLSKAADGKITCENGELIQIKLDTTLPRSYHREFMVAVRAGGTPSSMTKCFSMATTSF